MRRWGGERFAAFLEAYADAIEGRVDQLVATAHEETALPIEPRLRDAELPRTVDQLRQAAEAAEEGSWSRPTIDTKNDIRSMLGPIGPVVIFGPNNFPFAFNSIAGGDFAAAVAAGNPVIAIGHSGYPGTTQIFAEAALEAAQQTNMPNGFVQMLYSINHTDMMSLPHEKGVSALAFTGSKRTGLQLKENADKSGKPIYLELSSVNPVIILPGALQERADAIAEELVTSALMGAGQFCTNPGLVLLTAGPETEKFIADVIDRFKSVPSSTLLSGAVEDSILQKVREFQECDATLLTGGRVDEREQGYGVENTLMRVNGNHFLASLPLFQTEIFGNSTLVVVAEDVDQLMQMITALEGQLTGCIYSAMDGSDDEAYDRIAPELRTKVGRLLNDKMPTGVAVSPAMNHGGPFPAASPSGVTAVGMPTAIERFAVLQCYDNVRQNRLPELLRDDIDDNSCWRNVDGGWE